MFDEIIKNIDWTKIVLALITAGGLFIGFKQSIKQTQKSGSNSKNFQANGNITINGNTENER